MGQVVEFTPPRKAAMTGLGQEIMVLPPETNALDAISMLPGVYSGPAPIWSGQLTVQPDFGTGPITPTTSSISPNFAQLAAALPQPSAPAPPATAPATSWMSQQMISGIPNSYLLYGGIGIALLAALAGARGRG